MPCHALRFIHFWLSLSLSFYLYLSHRHTLLQTHAGTHTQTHRNTNTQTHFYTDPQTRRHINTRTHRHADTQTHRRTDTQTHLKDFWGISECSCVLRAAQYTVEVESIKKTIWETINFQMQSRHYSLGAMIAALVIVDQKTARNLAATSWISKVFFDDSITYGVATISRHFKILGLFCKRAL